MLLRFGLACLFLFHSCHSYSLDYVKKFENPQKAPAYDIEQFNSQLHSSTKALVLQDSKNKQKANQRVEQEQNMKLVGADVHTEIEMPVNIKIVTVTEDEANAIIAKKEI